MSEEAIGMQYFLIQLKAGQQKENKGVGSRWRFAA
jgi:hypothetical protein